MPRRLPLLIAALLVLAGPVAAQPLLTVPRASPHASVTQRVGLTDLTIDYHRPAVNGRAVWGALVPWDQVWRAGANDNTTLTTSSPVTIGGQRLDAGTYGLHLIPSEAGPWTLILSTTHTAWGSFSYDPAEDAVRAAVTVRAAPMQERLAFRFDDPTDDAVTAVLHWEKVEVPIPVSVDTPEVVLASMEREMRGLPRFGWQGWNQIAAYAAQHDRRLDEALGWAEQSVAMTRTFTNTMTVAGLQDALGRSAETGATRASAMALATEAELNAYGYQLLGQGRTDEAVALFRLNTEQHPDSWNVWDSYAEGLAAQGDTAGATAQYETARRLAPTAQHARIDGLLAGLRGEN